MTNKIRINDALKVAFQYGQIDGEHHKAWVIDQMCRCLLGDEYEDWVIFYENGDENGYEYEWEAGIAP